MPNGSGARFVNSVQHAAFADESDDFRQALTGFHVAEDERTCAALHLGIMRHDVERGADHRRQIDLVDDQQIGLGDARAALARDLLAGCDVDDVEREVGELGRKGRGEVVTAGFDEDQLD